MSGIPPELVAVIGAWEELPPAIKRAVLALVESARESSTDEIPGRGAEGQDGAEQDLH
jgi:hypothetical protein